MNSACLVRMRIPPKTWGILAIGAAAVVNCRAPTAEQHRSPAATPSARQGVKASRPAAPSDAISPSGEEYAYSYPVQFYEFQSQRQTRRMAYLDVLPERPNGLAVLLLHGKNFSADSWTSTIRLLSEAGFRVVAPDQIGFGKSSKPEAYQFTFSALARHTRALLEFLNVDKVAVVGHSMGGMLAARYALSYPEHTAKLALVNPLGLEDYGAVVPYQTVDEWYQRELALTPEKIREYQKRAYYAGEWKPEYEQLARLQLGFVRHPEYPKLAYISALTYDMIVTQPVVHDLPRLRMETLLIIGQRDRTAVGRDLAAPALAEKMGDFGKLGRAARARIPKAKLVEIAGAGHLPQVEAFEAYSQALLEFLGNPPPGLHTGATGRAAVQGP